MRRYKLLFRFDHLAEHLVEWITEYLLFRKRLIYALVFNYLDGLMFHILEFPLHTLWLILLGMKFDLLLLQCLPEGIFPLLLLILV